MSNDFRSAVSSHDATTENLALSHGSMGSAILDHFSKSGTYRCRELEEVICGSRRDVGGVARVGAASDFLQSS